MKKLWIVWCLCAMACSQPETTDALASLSAEEAPSFLSHDAVPRDVAEVAQAAPARPDRKIIRTATLHLDVDHAAQRSRQIDSLAQTHGGYVGHSEQQQTSVYTRQSPHTRDSVRVVTGTRSSIRVVVRVPADHYAAVLQALEQLATRVTYRATDTQDVSEEFVDLEARLRTKREVEERYIDILRKQATQVEDILAAEDKLRKIREEIEVAEGRLRYLQHQVGFSTIQLELQEPVRETIHYAFVVPTTEPAPEFFFTAHLADGLRAGWQGILYALVGLSYAWPLLVLAFGVAALRWQRTQKAKAP
ncbi:protein of unknown function [Catalinimonas alkaloidigena]|uniref:DUF4349 domain-containing protein n=1 Tax=Catalinimonas alkaloidigena TaxID=1075417 RepID=A0A1G8X6X1_9BACT|nr:DUF4349 domain-containing protein [Catalinimonas alkaloidigena]SDJ86147.1 protein of unknown function [Catalinimonas alkaloidigena]